VSGENTLNFSQIRYHLWSGTWAVGWHSEKKFDEEQRRENSQSVIVTQCFKHRKADYTEDEITHCIQAATNFTHEFRNGHQSVVFALVKKWTGVDLRKNLTYRIFDGSNIFYGSKCL